MEDCAGQIVTLVCLFVALGLITGLGDSRDELDFSRGWVAGLEYFGVWIVLYTPQSLIMNGNILKIIEMTI